MIKFVTSNSNKFKEVHALVPVLEHLDVDLPEIQELNPKLVIQAKLDHAAQLHPGVDLVVEDTSLSLDALNNFPGPLIKWLLQAVKDEGIYHLAEQLRNRLATARTIVGYRNSAGKNLYFEGVLNGQIVAPQGETGFGWDTIFMPDGFAVTFAEMDEAEKVAFSMRTEAFRKLKQYLDLQAERG